MSPDTDTIVAIATAPGRSGIGVVRLSGADAFEVAGHVVGKLPFDSGRGLRQFRDVDGAILDEGLVLVFRGPHSFTGEDVVELQGHGSPVVLDALVDAALSAGARLAEPGEFSKRAFLNDRLDLVQAEAVADLIDAGSRQAARSAMRSLSGEFSRRIDDVVEQLIVLRMMMEAAIDFPEEEIDFLSDAEYGERMDALITAMDTLGQVARQGELLASGVDVVIAGRPNAGKSSLLNRLAGSERAIVDAAPGTTRDIVDVRLQIDGLPVRLLDTAGIRDTGDSVEEEGVRRAEAALTAADLVLHVIDDTTEDYATLETGAQVVRVFNKSDRSGRPPGHAGDNAVSISATTGAGIESLVQAIKNASGYAPVTEDATIARRRHVDAIRRASEHIQAARVRLMTDRAGELAAEELRLAQNQLGEITGVVTSDDLLGRIFASFCIGK